MATSFSGRLAPSVAVAEIFPLRAYPQALEQMMSDQHFGKLVLEIG